MNAVFAARVFTVITSLLALHLPAIAAPAAPTNILLITADDLGYEAVNCLGGKVPDVTPNIDRLAAGGMNFQYGYVNCAICAPSRGVIATGRYGFNSGLLGFNKLPAKIPTTFATFQANGYRTGILGKVSHSTPDTTFTWDFSHDQNELGDGRSPQKYYEYCKEFFTSCREAGKPFYFMVNSHDPHRPFHNPARARPEWAQPSRLFTPGEIAVPTYLADLPEVRQELSHYYNSVRRFDDTLGKILQALDESGMRENTLVVMQADNGSAFPFAKANTYPASNKTPFILSWPAVIKPGSVDSDHLVSEVDLFPTFMEACNLPAPAGLDGRSLVPLLRGEKQAGRDFVITEINYTIGGPRKPMRCIQTKQYAYIFNGFSDGKFQYSNNNEGESFKAMKAAAAGDPFCAERVQMFRFRVPQEFYDLEKDPGCIHNLISNPEYASVAGKFQTDLRQWMAAHQDICIEPFDARNSPAELATKMAAFPTLPKSAGIAEEGDGEGGKIEKRGKGKK